MIVCGRDKDAFAKTRESVQVRERSSGFRFSRGPALRLAAVLFGILLVVAAARGAETLPPAPRDHFNDHAGMVSPQVANRLNTQLTEFERETSNQIVVAIYPKMQSDSSIEDYTVRVAQSWKVGTAERRNGAVLFVFRDDRSLFIQVGYGLEGVLPDARCKQIIENEITPRFRSGDFEGGIAAGVQAILASIRGEYQGTGATVADRENRTQGGGGLPSGIIGFIILILIMRGVFGNRRNTVYTPLGRRAMWNFPGSRGGFGGGNWGGGSWGGGGSSGGGGSFSGGGGSFGGGGAGGRW